MRLRSFAPVCTAWICFPTRDSIRARRSLKQERDAFGLHGLLPPHIGTLEDQRERRKRVLDRATTAFGKYSNMRDLQDNDETLFYSMIEHYTEELLPWFTRRRWARAASASLRSGGGRADCSSAIRIETELSRFLRTRATTMCAASWSATASASLGWATRARVAWEFLSARWRSTPRWEEFRRSIACRCCWTWARTTKSSLNDPIYIGWQHHRVRGQEYDNFVEAFVAAVQRRWPHILLQWEDFAGTNAARLLERYRDRLCTFNDDIQGTAAVTTATLLAAVNATGVPLSQQTIVMFGSGSAGIGIIDLLIAAMKEEGLSEEQARSRIYAFNRYGLLVEGARGIKESQLPLVRKRADIAGWQLEGGEDVSLLDVVRNAKVTVLAGVSAQAELLLKRSCARWRGTPSGRSSFPCRIRPRSLRRHRLT